MYTTAKLTTLSQTCLVWILLNIPEHTNRIVDCRMNTILSGHTEYVHKLCCEYYDCLDVQSSACMEKLKDATRYTRVYMSIFNFGGDIYS